ncbi:hypothetical protein LTR08_000305 [Meristemomyces frigidus]|nr:hypothetical protein LTR08_000305 [Meristemomyces frigidus]
MDSASCPTPPDNAADKQGNATCVISPTNAEEQVCALPKSTRSEPKTGFRNFWRILSHATWLDRCVMTVAAISSAGSGATLPLMNIVFGSLVGSFNGYFVPGSTVAKGDFLASVNRGALYIVYLFIAKFVLGYVSIYAFRMAGIRISAAIRLAYLLALFNQPISAVDKLPPGAATDSLTTVANTIQLAVGDKLAIFIQGMALIVAAYVVAFRFSWSITLVSSSVIIFLFLVIGGSTVPLLKHERLVMESNAGASAVAGECLGAVRTVKSLCAEDAMVARHAVHVAQAKAQGLRKSPWVGAVYLSAFFSIYATMALTFWFGAKLYSQNEISDIGTVVTVLYSVMMVTVGLSMVVQPLQNISKAAAASVACFKIIDAPQLKAGGLKEPEVQATHDIRFENVHFAYPGRPQVEILKGLSLTFQAGKVTALTGASGCGKSTIVALLEKWYQLSDVNVPLLVQADDEYRKISTTKEKTAEDISNMNEKNVTKLRDDGFTGSIVQNSGHITVDKHNIEDLDRKWWRVQIGLVQQEPFLFNESIYSNVARGLTGSRWAMEPQAQQRAMVEEACREAYADEFIERLPDGYETMVGESGIKLSGGQRQRLAIARSIVKRPAILVLDEASSAIDVHSERIVEAALERASRNRTTITIAHRLSTIRRADCIFVINEGVAIEHGTHNELMAHEHGVYANLVRAQHLELGGDADEQSDSNAATTAAAIKVIEPDSRQLLAAPADNTNGPHAATKDDANAEKSASPPGPATRGLFGSMGIFLYEQREHWLIYALILLGAMIACTGSPLQAYIFSHVVVVFQYTGRQLISSSRFWALMFFILALCVAVGYAVIGHCTTSLAVHVSTAYRKSYFETVLVKPVPWFDEEDHTSGTLSGQLSTDPQQIQEVLGPNMALPLVAVLNVVGCTIISFVFGWKLTLVLLFSALPVIFAASFLRMRYEKSFEAMNANVFAESSKFAGEAIGAFRTVTALTLEDTIIQRYRTLLRGHVSEAFMKARFSVLIFALSDSLELCCMALAFWYGGQLLGRHEYTALQFFIIFTATIQGGQAAGQLMALAPNAAQATAAANRILAFRDGSEKSASEAVMTLANTSSGVSVEFQDVGFTYPTRDTPVYRHLSFRIGGGDYIAFVGPSGCGKTTIISLLERFYTADSGQILIDSTNITRLPLAPYRSLCALVNQEPTLFEGTVRDNLVMGLPSPHDNTAVEEACKAAEIYDFVSSLPQGFDTSLSAGSHTSLSGGQKQRLCIARALLRKPRLLLLDEATSSLDSQSERLVQQAIERIARSRSVTVIVVAHRLATVQNADRIVVLSKGGVVCEDGTHTALVHRRGLYWQMCTAQALDR